MLPAEIRDARLQDYLLAMGFSGAVAVVYFLALKAPNRNYLTRLVNRNAVFWSRMPMGVPPRIHMMVVAVVGTAICLGVAILFILDLGRPAPP